MKHGICIAGIFFAFGCGLANPAALDPSTEKEQWALSEVIRFSAKLHKSIEGRIVEKGYRVPPGVQNCPADSTGCDAAAWYGPGPVVYFWQPFVNRESTSFINLSDVAAHEVCHSLSPNHDQLHWNCIRTIGGDPQYVPRD